MASSLSIAFAKGNDVLVPFKRVPRPVWLTTSSQLRLTVRANEGSASALITKSTGSGLAITLSETEDFFVVFASADTNGAGFHAGGSYYVALERTDPGSRLLLAEGPLQLLTPEFEP
jgi:hypothetical protein